MSLDTPRTPDDVKIEHYNLPETSFPKLHKDTIALRDLYRATDGGNDHMKAQHDVWILQHEEKLCMKELNFAEELKSRFSSGAEKIEKMIDGRKDRIKRQQKEKTQAQLEYNRHLRVYKAKLMNGSHDGVAVRKPRLEDFYTPDTKSMINISDLYSFEIPDLYDNGRMKFFSDVRVQIRNYEKTSKLIEDATQPYRDRLEHVVIWREKAEKNLKLLREKYDD